MRFRLRSHPCTSAPSARMRDARDDLARPDDRRRVIVSTSRALPPEHRFIEAPLRNLSRWSPVILCADRDPRSLPLVGIPVVSLDPPMPRPLWWGLRRLRGLQGRVSHRDRKTVCALGGALVHAHWGTHGVLVAPLAKAAGLPLVVTLHGFDITRHEAYWTSGAAGWWHRDYPRRLRAIAAEGAHFIAVSRAIRRLALAWGIPESQVHYAPIGIDTASFHPSGVPMIDRPAKVLFVGTHIPLKGGDVLIRAMARVRAAIPDAQVVFIGDGPELTAWKALASHMNVRAHFLGRLPPERVREELADTVVFCLPSVRPAGHALAEGFGLVVIEAAAAGVPVITSAQGMESEGVDDGRTGFAIDYGDEVALAHRIETILKDRPLAQRLGSASPPFVREHFDLKACTRRVEDVYDEVTHAWPTVGHGARG
jgi:glycosyltransferase involved in cell wall biosynthesis